LAVSTENRGDIKARNGEENLEMSVKIKDKNEYCNYFIFAIKKNCFGVGSVNEETTEIWERVKRGGIFRSVVQLSVS
jgi:hypothetical protein